MLWICQKGHVIPKFQTCWPLSIPGAHTVSGFQQLHQAQGEPVFGKFTPSCFREVWMYLMHLVCGVVGRGEREKRADTFQKHDTFNWDYTAYFEQIQRLLHCPKDRHARIVFVVSLFFFLLSWFVCVFLFPPCHYGWTSKEKGRGKIRMILVIHTLWLGIVSLMKVITKKTVHQKLGGWFNPGLKDHIGISFLKKNKEDVPSNTSQHIYCPQHIDSQCNAHNYYLSHPIPYYTIPCHNPSE